MSDQTILDIVSELEGVLATAPDSRTAEIATGLLIGILAAKADMQLDNVLEWLRIVAGEGHHLYKSGAIAQPTLH